MSWDVTIQRFSKEYAYVNEIPDSERRMALGSGAEVRTAINRFFPTVDWTDIAWGVFESDSGSVEFNMGKDEPNTGFMMHIRASNKVVPAIVAMCLSERWQALDCGDGVFFEKVSNPSAGLENWSVYRNQVVGEN